jgi:histone arginine demethylase JMJD6
MGPERSGTTVHIDPLMTSAWNASVAGHKRWVLFSASTPKSIVKGKEFRDRHYQDEAINYFVEILPKIKQKYTREELQITEFIQRPG